MQRTVIYRRRLKNYATENNLSVPAQIDPILFCKNATGFIYLETPSDQNNMSYLTLPKAKLNVIVFNLFSKVIG